MRAVVALTEKVGPTGLPVLLVGETGTGKEVIAELVHKNSDRHKKEMVCVNCAGLPSELIESELFGSSKGSYTGSLDRIGLMRHAHTSTVFLDELSEMPLHLQAKLLRFLQDKRIRRVGSTGEETVDVRIIAAINRPPDVCIKQQRLREDLYYRLSTITIRIPPLRQRPEDILPLADAYLNFFSEQFDRTTPVIDKDAKDLILRYEWPGNVRQLQNEMNRCALLCDGKVGVNDLALHIEDDSDIDLQSRMSARLDSLTLMEKAEAQIIVKTLRENSYNVTITADKLGVSRQTLYQRIKVWGIKTAINDVQFSMQTPAHNAPAMSSIPTADDSSPAGDFARNGGQHTEAFDAAYLSR